MLSKIKKILFVFLIAAFVSSGCARNTAPSVPPEVEQSGLPKIDPAKVIANARVYYNGGVERETNLTDLRIIAEAKLNTFRTTAHDLIANNAACFKDVAATEAFVGAAVMSNQDGDALFSGLATQSVSAEQATTECTKLNRQLADFIIANRQAVQDAWLASAMAANEYVKYTSNFPEIDFMNDLMQTYFDTAKVYEKLADAGIGVSDWSWLPTANLRVNIGSNKARCDYYLTGEFMTNLRESVKRKFTGHEDALMGMYEAEWDPTANGGRGLCTLYKYAALKEMTIIPMSSDSQEILTTGEDQGLFPTETPVVPVP